MTTGIYTKVFENGERENIYFKDGSFLDQGKLSVKINR